MNIHPVNCNDPLCPMALPFSSQNHFRIFLPVFLAFFLQACQSHNGKQPTADIPAQWQEQQENNTAAQDSGKEWWLEFDDPILAQLIDKALKQNTDRRLALARIEEARAVTRNAAAQIYPSINAAASATRRGIPNNGNNFRSGIIEQYDAGLDASWEIDLFGRIRNAAQAARTQENAFIAESDAVTLSVIGEVARQYTLYRLYREQATLAQNNATAQQGVLRITEARYRQGVEGNLEVMRSRALLESTQAQIPLYQDLAQTASYQIDYLLGDKPGENGTLLTPDQTLPVIDRDVFMDVPVNVIRRRPDIIAAEQNLLSATSLTRAAIAELYPSLSISGALGLTAPTIGNLLNSNSKNWSVGGSLLAPLFNFGRIRSNIDAAKSREEQALIRYEQTVLNSLREVETAASSYRRSKTRHAALDQARLSSNQAADIARKQYHEGILSQLDVLAAEQSAYNAQEASTQAAAELTANYIALCMALALR